MNSISIDRKKMYLDSHACAALKKQPSKIQTAISEIFDVYKSTKESVKLEIHEAKQFGADIYVSDSTKEAEEMTVINLDTIIRVAKGQF